MKGLSVAPLFIWSLVRHWQHCCCWTLSSSGVSSSFLSTRIPLVTVTTRKRICPAPRSGPSLVMRDRSVSYWFQIGDPVRVVQDVYRGSKKENLKGFRGIVVETWEKCDVDPTCCCAEQVDCGMAVRVQFTNVTSSSNRLDCTVTRQRSQQEDVDQIDGDNDDIAMQRSFSHYFAEEELSPVTPTTTETLLADTSLPFDGLTCQAFKLQKIETYQKNPRRIASFEAHSYDLE